MYIFVHIFHLLLSFNIHTCDNRSNSL